MKSGKVGSCILGYLLASLYWTLEVQIHGASDSLTVSFPFIYQLAQTVSNNFQQSRKSERKLNHASRIMKIVYHASRAMPSYASRSWARSRITLIIWDTTRVTENPFATRFKHSAPVYKLIP